MPTNYNVQALRALAALAVLLFHARPFYEDVVGAGMPGARLLFYGYAGVDVFFVISGYVIALTTSAYPPGLASLARFAEKRCFRIYLGYWPLLALVAAYYYSLDPQRLARVEPLAAIFLTTPDISRLVIGQSWSLVYELFFYGLFAGLLLLRRGWRPWLLRLYFLLVLAVAAGFGPAGAGQYLPLQPYVLEFIAGAMLFQAANGMKDYRLLAAAAVMTLLLLALGMGLDARSGLPRAATFGGAGLSMLAVAVNLGNLGFNFNGVLARLGAASYTLYLGHYACLEAYSGLAHGGAGATWLASGPAYAVFLSLLLWLSYGYYLAVEKPLYVYACSLERWRPSTYLGRRPTRR